MCFANCANMLNKVFFCLSSQKKLTTLDIAANRIKKIENVSHLTELQEFWVWTIYGLEQKFNLTVFVFFMQHCCTQKHPKHPKHPFISDIFTWHSRGTTTLTMFHLKTVSQRANMHNSSPLEVAQLNGVQPSLDY